MDPKDIPEQLTKLMAAMGGDLDKATKSNPMGKAVSTMMNQEDGEEPAAGSSSAAAAPGPSANEIRKAMELLNLYQAQAPTGSVKTTDEALKKHYKFWETQPVPRIDENVAEDGAIDVNKKVEEIRKIPLNLPPAFVWDTLDIDDPAILRELYELLNENYVEDDDNMFRFDYSPNFLQWALKPPGWRKEWHCGIRAEKSRKLVGFISAIPATIRVHDRTIKMVEINFLCVLKKLRSKRMAPVLIQEITRRVNLTGIFQAVYTAGVVIPKPVGQCRYWHRSLNPKKLIDVKFSHLSRNMTMQRTVKLYKLPEDHKLEGFRKMEKKDVKKVAALLNGYLEQFDLVPIYTQEEVAHWFLPRFEVVDSFVVEDPKTKEIKAFTSYYTLPSTVMHHPVHKNIKAAYSFYNVPGEGILLQDVVGDALVLAKNAGYDVFNALDLMHNKQFLSELKFGIGDGNLQYYLFNWKCRPVEPEKIGLVLQ